MFIFIVAASLLISSAGISLAVVDNSPFMEAKSTHFRVRFTMPDERPYAGVVLNKAEEYYLRIADDIGYARYQDFWTWDRRVVITLYPDQYAYLRFTGSPQWSKGFASRDTRLFREHAVVSYNGQENFLDEVLPHEIAHLMLWDYLAQGKSLPVWFEEGVAQLQESGKADVVQTLLKPVVMGGKYIPIESFNVMNITGEKEPTKVSLFYAQSLSVVLFLIQKYGRDAFHRFCHELRDGKSFENALNRAYPSVIRSLGDLQDRWVRSFQ
ncbi:MAG: hypothetical protein V2A70_03985 [Candidatus Omnitrophota bacterium]